MNLLENRKKLHYKLKKICENVYFNPPANINLKYPCIIYHRLSTDSKYADNTRYQTQYNYRITVLDSVPDSSVVDKLLEEFDLMDIAGTHISDRLYHYYFDYKSF
nr:MAG TPA: tail completion protein [Caudoviricetes sp.]